MAFPFKTGGDFYNCEAQRMRLHNLGANPTETATGLMYFNTGASNLGKHAVVHDGTKFKALAFVDEIATNEAFTELKKKVDLLIGDDVDTDTIIDSWKEVQAFLADIEDTKTLQGMLSSYLPKSGGILRDSWSGGTEIRRADSNNGNVMLSFSRQDGTIVGGLGFGGIDNPIFVTQAGGQNTLLHKGNYATEIGDYYLKSSGGKIKDANGTPLVLDTSSSLVGVHLRVQGSTKAQVGWDVNNGAYLYNSATGEQLSLAPSGGAKLYIGNKFETLLHSGNIGDYATRSYGIVGANYAKGNWHGYSYGTEEHGKGVTGGVMSAGTNANGFQINGMVDGSTLVFRGYNASGFTDWKIIAFTDSDIKGNAGSATKLQTARTIWGQSFDGSGNVSGSIKHTNGWSFIDPSDGYVIFGYDYAQNNKPTYIDGKEICLRYGISHTTGLTLNSSGNVLIGTPNELKSGAKLQIKGDVYVDGNIIATKEVSAGGAGQEGASGDGGAEVIDKELAKGQSSYTIPNTIGRSAVAVSLYEWNANNSSWDMCLADISVKDATITVTFGSATSVNHKLVAVG